MSRLRRAVMPLVGALCVVGAIIGRPPHPHFWWDGIPGIQALLGLAGAWLLVFVAKSILAPFLERPRDYYDA